MEQEQIYIAVADDHPMVISGLINMMRGYAHLHIKWQYDNGDALLNGIASGMPDVLLLDIQMPGKTGVEIASVIRKKYPSLPILVLTNLDSVLYVYNLMKMGVTGYLLKTTTEDVLIQAISEVFAGREFLEPEMRGKLDDFTSKMRREASLQATLTKRELEILTMIVNGSTTKEISEQLFLGYRTVESYRFNILLKLDAKNTAILVRKALELGIIG